MNNFFSDYIEFLTRLSHTPLGVLLLILMLLGPFLGAWLGLRIGQRYLAHRNWGKQKS